MESGVKLTQTPAALVFSSVKWGQQCLTHSVTDHVYKMWHLAHRTHSVNGNISLPCPLADESISIRWALLL